MKPFLLVAILTLESANFLTILLCLFVAVVDCLQA
jgi:hypothetical protein